MADEVELPTEAEIRQLPRWARVAFAARCARRVLPLVRHYWKDAPEDHCRPVQIETEDVDDPLPFFSQTRDFSLRIDLKMNSERNVTGVNQDGRHLPRSRCTNSGTSSGRRSSGGMSITRSASRFAKSCRSFRSWISTPSGQLVANTSRTSGDTGGPSPAPSWIGVRSSTCRRNSCASTPRSWSSSTKMVPPAV
jgi:hypothetical protein